MTPCLIALGGNVEVSATLFSDAIAALEVLGFEQPRLSNTRTSQPMGSVAGNEFLNAAATGNWAGTSAELLATLHRVEAQFGRQRSIHWGPRTLDLDLILFRDEVHTNRKLAVPHPAMWYRRFVLEPANDVAPEMRHPILQVTVAALLDRMNQQPLIVTLQPATDWTSEDAESLVSMMSSRVPQIQWTTEVDSSAFATVQFATDHLFLTWQNRAISVLARSLPEVENDLLDVAVAILG